jgi:hypothetical protein
MPCAIIALWAINKGKIPSSVTPCGRDSIPPEGEAEEIRPPVRGIASPEGLELSNNVQSKVPQIFKFNYAALPALGPCLLYIFL